MTDSELIEKLTNCLKYWMPIIEAHVESSHLVEGFNRKRNVYDECLDKTKIILQIALKVKSI